MSAFAEARAARLPDAFVRALTVGGPPPTHLPRPIEVHAHDAPRYVSDMLAWVHQALANERELVAALLAHLAAAAPPAAAPPVARRPGEPHAGLDLSVDLRTSSWLVLRDARGALPQPVVDALVRRIVERNVAGCCRPLKARVQQTLSALGDAPTLLRLYYILQFYYATMTHTIGPHAALCATLVEYVRRSP